MAKASTGLAGPRDWRLVALIGGASLVLSVALLRGALPAGAVVAMPEPWASLATAGLFTLMASATTLILLTQRLRAINRRMRVALNNMSQGLCMFDRNERPGHLQQALHGNVRITGRSGASPAPH